MMPEAYWLTLKMTMASSWAMPNVSHHFPYMFSDIMHQAAHRTIWPRTWQDTAILQPRRSAYITRTRSGDAFIMVSATILGSLHAHAGHYLQIQDLGRRSDARRFPCQSLS
jgi:hypothetical protein